MPNIFAKNQMEVAEDPTINNFFKSESRKFWICSVTLGYAL